MKKIARCVRINRWRKSFAIFAGDQIRSDRRIKSPGVSPNLERYIGLAGIMEFRVNRCEFCSSLNYIQAFYSYLLRCVYNDDDNFLLIFILFIYLFIYLFIFHSTERNR